METLHCTYTSGLVVIIRKTRCHIRIPITDQQDELHKTSLIPKEPLKLLWGAMLFPYLYLDLI